MAGKREWRAHFKKLRAGIPVEERQRIDAAIAQQVLALPEFAACELVLPYLSFGAEIETRSIIQAAWEAGKTVALPRCVPGTRDMKWYVVDSFDGLVKSSLGVEEPAEDPTREIDPATFAAATTDAATAAATANAAAAIGDAAASDAADAAAPDATANAAATIDAAAPDAADAAAPDAADAAAPDAADAAAPDVADAAAAADTAATTDGETDAADACGAGAAALVLVPGLTFDAQGFRMGYGGGFYDTFLSTFRGVSVGLCRECQFSDHVPGLEPHDLAVQIVVTESRALTVSSCTCSKKRAPIVFPHES